MTMSDPIADMRRNAVRTVAVNKCWWKVKV